MHQKSVAFKVPAKKPQKIWRYMSLQKYESLISSSALYFCLIKHFQDPFEGVYPKKSLQAHEKRLSDLVGRKRFLGRYLKPGQYLADYTHLAATCCYVNCWHMNDHESAAMWSIYSADNKGIAVQSTYQDLKMAIANAPEPVCIGVVEYLDYAKDLIPSGYLFEPFLHKRRSFEHERELRALYYRGGNMSKRKFRRGFFISVDLHRLIRRVYVHPTASKTFYEKVLRTTKAVLNVPVIKSDLYDRP